MSHIPAKDDQTVDPVQWLRGLAAMMVVVHHARNPAAWLHNPLEGYDAFGWGVDIFFVISGFIMFVAARNEAPLRFVQRRLIRVVPLYWLATLALLCISARQHGFALSGAEWGNFFKSLLFVPHLSLTHPGEIWPFLVPGWTLNYEMFFYGVFFVALLAKRPLAIVTATMLGLVAAGVALPRTDANPLWVTYTDPLLLEFVAGLWIGQLHVSGRLRRWMVALGPLGLAGLLVAVPVDTPDPSGTLIRLVSSAMVLIGAVSAARSAPDIRAFKALGDASYSIYLSHTVIGLPIAKAVVSRLPLDGSPQFLVWIAASLAICAAIGWAIHVAVERPLLEWLRGRVSGASGSTRGPRASTGS